MILLAAISDILFSNQLALLALASIIPLIILYLLRPRTIDLDIPSLLFFLKREDVKKDITPYLIWAVLGLIILELIIIKRRRELS
jgi:hypothetical protein